MNAADNRSELILAQWIQGFIAQDLDILSDCPGVDADRRILRLAFFGYWAGAYTGALLGST